MIWVARCKPVQAFTWWGGLHVFAFLFTHSLGEEIPFDWEGMKCGSAHLVLATSTTDTCSFNFLADHKPLLLLIKPHHQCARCYFCTLWGSTREQPEVLTLSLSGWLESLRYINILSMPSKQRKSSSQFIYGPHLPNEISLHRLVLCCEATSMTDDVHQYHLSLISPKVTDWRTMWQTGPNNNLRRALRVAMTAS